MVRLCGMLLAVLLSSNFLLAQTVSLSGHVYKTGGTVGIQGVRVALVNIPSLSTTTDAQGVFSISQTSIQLQPQQKSRIHYTLTGNRLIISSAPQTLNGMVELYSSDGRENASIHFKGNTTGNQSVVLPAFGSGLTIIRIIAGGETVTSRIVRVGGAMYLKDDVRDVQASDNFALAKLVTASLDSLIATKTNYDTGRAAVTSYNQQNINIYLDSSIKYQGPCDVLPNGCAEAYSMARAMTANYTGPLFQVGLTNDNTKKLDIRQTSGHKADTATLGTFCGGNQSNLRVSKIYAQIHSGSNDLVPGVFNAPYGPNCSAGGYTCAAKFTMETATGLPILTTDAPQEYTIAADAFATGVNGGRNAMSIMYNGKPVANQVYCCGVFGCTHKYNGGDNYGTDFMVALAYGWKDGGGCCIAVNCGANNKYCVGAEEEENNDLYDYSSSLIGNAMVVTQFDPTSNTVTSYLNGTLVLSHSPPKAALNVGTAIHVGGGGDLSQPDPVRMREALIANKVMSASEVTAMKNNITSFFSTLTFP